MSKEEVDDLSNKKLKYKWEVPAVDMSNCKWMGTGECFLKVRIAILFYVICFTLFDYPSSETITLLFICKIMVELVRAVQHNAYKNLFFVPEFPWTVFSLFFYFTLCLILVSFVSYQRNIYFHHDELDLINEVVGTLI